MAQFRKVEIHKQARIFDDFFKIDELVVAHQKVDGTMSADQRRLVFERGDSAAVMLFNTDTKCVVVVNQFKAPTLGKGLGGGWLDETLAGMVERYETPESTAVRETLEETGYKIVESRLKLIAKFFSSPGGTSECIYLYYAEVSDKDKVGSGGGAEGEGEDIQVMEIPLDDLLANIKAKRVEDPKLLIGAAWLGEELKDHARRTLDYSSIKYECVKQPGRFVGYKTGAIKNVKDVSIWVNSENEDMTMDRFIGRSISANIRYLGADKDPAGNITEDIINDELEGAIGRRSPVRIGTVIETGAGALGGAHGVHAVYHVATVRGAGAGLGVRADAGDLARCVQNVLAKVDEKNRNWWWFRRRAWIRNIFGMKLSESILIPMIGSGDGGLQIEQIVPQLLAAAVRHFEDNPDTTLKEVFFLAYTAGQKTACDREIAALQDKRILKKEPADHGAA